MATIEELERLGTYLAEAESKAIRDLVDHLRDAAEALPDGSRLAVVFAKHARQLERYEDLAVDRDDPGRPLGALNLLNELERMREEAS